MVQYSVAVAILVSLTFVESFGPHTPWTTSLLKCGGEGNSLRRHLSTSSLHDHVYSENDQVPLSIKATFNNLSAIYLDSLSRVGTLLAADEEDIYEAEVELKKKIIKERSGSYEVTLPLVETSTPLGVSLCQVESREFSDMDLNLDSLLLQTPASTTDEALQTIDQSAQAKRLGPKFRGVVVSSVMKGGRGWNEGIRPGDVLMATSATMGEALWPKRTLEGVRSAISSRKIVSGTMTFQFQRTNMAEEVGELYELTLTRPIGIEVEETKDGYIRVSGFTENAPKLVRFAIQEDDRILAVESLTGSMWPVSTVDGLISACTSRLPGQSVTIRFARPSSDKATKKEQTQTSANAVASVAEATLAPPEGAVNGGSTVANIPPPQTAAQVSRPPWQNVAEQTGTKTSEEALRSRCREVLRRYMTESEEQKQARFSDKYSVPSLVADRVLEALASASASLDSKTLALVMKSYLSCRKPEGAIRAFEAAVGLKGDGSSAPVTTIIEGKNKDGNRLVTNVAALNLYTASSLLRAHALKGDIQSVRRVLAALEGRSGLSVNGIDAAAWPETGVYGSIVPDTQCYNIALAAAAKAGGKAGIDMATGLFDTMSEPREQSSRPHKDLVSYNTVIGALAKAGRYEDAFSVFESMKWAEVKPDKFTYTSLIKACVNDGDVQELLFDMKERGVQPDVITYNTMIKKLCDRYQWFEAKKLVTDMESRGIAPNSMTYGLLMNGLLKADKPGPCLTLFETACAYERTAALTENVHLYTTAIAATSALGDHERALDLVSRMKAVGVKPNVKTLTALMTTCLSAGRPDVAARIYQKIEKPDGLANILGFRAFCDYGDLASASALLSRERNGKRSMSGKDVMFSYDKLIRSALEQNDFDMARKTLTEFLQTGYIPSKTMFQTIVEALNLGPPKHKKGASWRTAVIEKPITDETFDFLLFVLDSIRERNLPCDGSFYASVLFCGARMGGLRRKVASILADARAHTDAEASSRMKVLMKEQRADERKTIGWEELLREYDNYKSELGNQVKLPALQVRVGNRIMRRVLSAEQAVTYDSGRRYPRRANNV